ncbi:MAG: BON domain-containing protein [Longimicrobiales bacterium]|nr:BON domain-containing protein [Longimicrobiales bacterium]
MADFEGTLNIEQMDDPDIAELIRQQLDEDEAFNPDTVDIAVDDGHVTVSGRVGTEAERQRVAQVLSGLGATHFDNDVVVDEAARAQRDAAADEAHVEDQEARAQIGESGKITTDTAEHLHTDRSDRLYGTKDMKKAIEEGTPYTPPDRPIQEGTEGDEQH